MSKFSSQHCVRGGGLGGAALLSSLLLMSAATKTMETGAQIVEQRCSLSALPTCEHHQALPLAHAHFFLLLYLDQAWRKIVV